MLLWGLVGISEAAHACCAAASCVSDLVDVTVLLQQRTWGKVRAQLVMLLWCVTAVCSAL